MATEPTPRIAPPIDSPYYDITAGATPRSSRRASSMEAAGVRTVDLTAAEKKKRESIDAEVSGLTAVEDKNRYHREALNSAMGEEYIQMFIDNIDPNGTGDGSMANFNVLDQWSSENPEIAQAASYAGKVASIALPAMRFAKTFKGSKALLQARTKEVLGDYKTKLKNFRQLISKKADIDYQKELRRIDDDLKSGKTDIAGAYNARKAALKQKDAAIKDAVDKQDKLYQAEANQNLDFLSDNLRSQLWGSIMKQGGIALAGVTLVEGFFNDISDVLTVNLPEGATDIPYQIRESGDGTTMREIVGALDDIRQFSEYGTGFERDVLGTNPLTKEKRLKITQALYARLDNLRNNKAKYTSAYWSGVSPEVAEAEAKKGQTKATPNTVWTNDAVVGEEEIRREVTVEKKKELVKKFLMERYKDDTGMGYVPHNFEAVFNELVPEAQMKFLDTPVGPMFYDGKTWKQVQLPERKVMTPKEERDAMRGVFGQRNPETGQYIPTELLSGTGIKLGGLFRGTDAAYDKYIEEFRGANEALAAIKRLREINNTFGSSLFPKLIGESKVLVSRLNAALRYDIVGGGTISNYEQQLIADVVPRPADVIRLKQADAARLDAIEASMRKLMRAKSEGYGLIYVDTGANRADMEATEAALRANMNLR